MQQTMLLGVLAWIAGACAPAPRNGYVLTDRNEAVPFTGITPNAQDRIQFQIENQITPGTWETFSSAVTDVEPALIDVVGIPWHIAMTTEILPLGATKQRLWRRAATYGDQRHISADFRSVSDAYGPLATFEIGVDECINSALDAGGGLNVILSCTSPEAPEVELLLPCGKPDQSCCLSHEVPDKCDAGRACDGWSGLCTVESGNEGQQCNDDYSCAEGLVCMRDGFTPAESVCEMAIGIATGAYGEIDNRCAEAYVPGMLVEMSISSWQTTSGSYDAREGVRLPPDNIAFPELAYRPDHVQSIARIPGSENERLFAMTVSNSDQNRRGGVFFVDLGQVDGDGGEAIEGGWANDRSKNRNVAYYEMTSDHPGGIAVLGQTLATVGVDSTNGAPSVWIYDVSDPVHTSAQDALIQKVRLNTFGESPLINSKISSLAMTRLTSGRFLMAVGGDSLPETRSVWLYVSESDVLSSQTRWRFHNYLSYTVATGAENIHFVTQCDGTIYLVHTSNPYWGLGQSSIRNYMIIHELVAGDDGKLNVDSTGPAGYLYPNEGYCSFRAGTGIHVTPRGELVIYCVGRSITSKAPNYRFAEIPEPCTPTTCPSE